MKLTALLILLTIISFTYGQEIKSYDLTLRIDVKTKHIQVEGTAEIDFHSQDTLKLVLWKNSSITKLTCRNTDTKFNFDTSSVTPIMYIPNGRKLILTKTVGSRSIQTLELNYECDMTNLSGWAKSFSENWIELNFYSSWFPVGLNGSNFNSKIKIYIDENYSVSGSGFISKHDGYWQFNQPWNGFDNVIIASKNLKSKKIIEDDITIETVYDDFSDSDADSMITECKFVLNLYKELFGVTDKTYLKFVIAPFEKGGGYSRKNFISMGTKQFNSYTRMGIGHEIAHFWWSNAGTTTWEDWLNESFAEYSMLIYFRERLGKNVFDKQIEEYKNKTKNSPPIKGIDRNSPEAYSVLYEKGAVILSEFENLVGEEKFFDLLQDIHKQKISNTKAFLELLESKLGTETMKWFEDKLKNG